MSVMSALERRNNAIALNGNTVNGATADIAITEKGSDWYFAVCAVMTLSTFAFAGLAMRKPRTHRVFHYITAGITMVASIAYFTMGSNLGFTPIAVEFQRNQSYNTGLYREIFYVRYIDWVITTPLLLLDLLLTAGMPMPTIAWVILVDEVMIITGLIGALVTSSYKWAYWVFGTIALFYIVYQLTFEARKHANHLGSDIGKVFLTCGSLTTVLWLLYPIAWGLCEGGNVLSADSEAYFYGVLDLFAKPVFGALLLFGHKNIDPSRLGLRIRDYDEDAAVHGGAVGHSINEKKHHNGVTGTNGTNGTNGTTATGTNGVTNGHHVATDPATTV